MATRPDPQAGHRTRGGLALAAIQRAARDHEALELRLQGLTFAAIAGAVGVANGTSARRMVQRALERRQGRAVEELRDLELARCERAIARFWPLVDCDYPHRAASEQLRWWLDYQAKLAGLYAPKRQTVDVDVHAHVTSSKVAAVRALRQMPDELEAVIDEHVAQNPVSVEDAELVASEKGAGDV